MQIELMRRTATALMPGQSIKISRDKMVTAAEGILYSLLFSVRRVDIKIFAEQVAQNWGVTMTEDAMTGEWTMFKPHA